MALPSTGQIDLASIGYEAKEPLLSAATMNDPALRQLCNKIAPASQISMSDFYGTAYGVGGGYLGADFTTVTNQIPGTTTVSNSIAIQDAQSTPVSMAISSSQPASYRINGGTWTDQSVLGHVKNGDTLQVEVVNANGYSLNSVVTVQYNGKTHTFTSVTGALSSNQMYIACQRTDSIVTLNGVLTNVSAFKWSIIYSNNWNRGAAASVGMMLSPPAYGTGTIAYPIASMQGDTLQTVSGNGLDSAGYKGQSNGVMQLWPDVHNQPCAGTYQGSTGLNYDIIGAGLKLHYGTL